MTSLHDAPAVASADTNTSSDDELFAHLVSIGMAPEWTTDPLGSVALREHRAAADPRVLIYDDAPTPAGTIELTFEQMFAAVLHHLQAMSPTNRHAVLQALHAVSVTQLLAEREPQSYGLEPQGRCEHWYSWLPPRVLGLVSARLKGKGASKLAALCETRHRHRARGQGRRIDRAKKKTSGNAWAMGERMVKTATTVGLVIERGDGLNCPEFSGGSRSWETPSNGKEEQVLSGDPGASGAARARRRGAARIAMGCDHVGRSEDRLQARDAA